MTTLRAAVKSAYTLTNVNWITAGFMVVFHVLAVAAFWFFSWQNLVVALVLHWMAVGFGISLGYHRLHTHRGYKTSKAFEYFLAICGTLTLEGGTHNPWAPPFEFLDRVFLPAVRRPAMFITTSMAGWRV